MVSSNNDPAPQSSLALGLATTVLSVMQLPPPSLLANELVTLSQCIFRQGEMVSIRNFLAVLGIPQWHALSISESCFRDPPENIESIGSSDDVEGLSNDS